MRPFDDQEFTIEHFMKMTRSLEREKLSDLACQVGAWLLIHDADRKTLDEETYHYIYVEDEDCHGTDLAVFMDLIREFIPQDSEAWQEAGISYIEVFPYSKHKKRLLVALRELAAKGFVELPFRYKNGNYEVILLPALNKYQTIPYCFLYPQKTA